MIYDLIIVGAGPIGLMLANLTVHQRNCSILIIEKQAQPSQQSRAIGVTPPTVDIFRSMGMAESLIERAVSIQTAVVHSRTSVLGKLTFDTLPGSQKAILSIPQYETESILEERLKSFSNVTILRGCEVTGAFQTNNIVEINYIDDEGIKQASCHYVAACDGANSVVRTSCGVTRRGDRYRDTFVMADFEDYTDLGTEAHLFFTDRGAVESFPLPNGKRRWVVQSKKYVSKPDRTVHCDLVRERTGIDLNVKDLLHISPFGVQHYINTNYNHGNIFFCGDSAHVMSPIGGQGMNTGFGDAEFLATVIVRSLEKGSIDPKLCKLYETCRKEAVRSAIMRAWISMRIGTTQGMGAPIRDFILKILLNSPLKTWGARHFAMLTIPCGTLISSQKRRPILSKMLSKHTCHP